MSHKNIQISLIAEKKNQVLNSLVLFGRTRETLIQEYTDQNRSVQGKNRLSWTRGFLLRSTEKNKTEQTSTYHFPISWKMCPRLSRFHWLMILTRPLAIINALWRRISYLKYHLTKVKLSSNYAPFMIMIPLLFTNNPTKSVISRPQIASWTIESGVSFATSWYGPFLSFNQIISLWFLQRIDSEFFLEWRN